jgi:hypothetical protein
MEATNKSLKQGQARGPRSLYKRPGGLVLTLIVVLIGAMLAIMYVLPDGVRINSRGYQVVYLASGQAFFGKLQNTDGKYVVIKDAYTTQDQTGAQDNAQSQTAIVKVSQQVYGPEDSLSIKSDQVVFWQNLRSDSKIVQAIEARS